MLSIQQNRMLKPDVAFKGSYNNSYHKALQGDKVSFSGKKDKPLEMGFLEKCKRKINSWRGYAFFTPEEIKTQINYALEKRGVERASMPKIKFDQWANKIELDPFDNAIKISHYDIDSIKDIEERVDAILSIVKTQEKLQGKMDAIAEESIRILGLEDKFTPCVTLFYQPTGTFGAYDPMGHKAVMNSYWLENAVHPELIIADIILHELSHAKTNLNSSLIPINDLMEELEKTPELLKKVQNDEHFEFRRSMCELLAAGSKRPAKGSPDYNRIMWHAIQGIKDDYNPKRGQVSASKITGKFDQMKRSIAKTCNIDYRELMGIDLKALLKTGKVKHVGIMANALFDDAHQKRIRESVESNKAAVVKILKTNTSIQEKFKQKYKGYADIYDEALARYTAASGILKMIEKGLVEDNKQTREFALNNINDLQMLILQTDPEVKELIESGQINLDSRLLEALKDD